MKIICRFLLCIACCVVVINKPAAQASLVYHDANTFLLTGCGFKDADRYQRLPLRFKDSMRPYLWVLSQQSAGISIYFKTNSPTIAVKWKTGQLVHFPHVAETLVRGVDLYAKENGTWYYAGVGRPTSQTNHEAVLAKNRDTSWKEFLLNLPMYETVDSVYIGIAAGFSIQNLQESPFGKKKPIVFYGTSILQGASAMRPGMAYPSLVARHLNRETINLGFSGNGLLETVIGQAMAEIDASCYVVDCGPNLSPAQARERTLPFLQQLKASRPHVPILLVENIIYPHARFDEAVRLKVDSVNRIFKDAYAALKKQGMKDLYYLPADQLIGTDGEATVDGVHLTDLGFMRMAQKMEEVLRKILK